MTHKRYVKLKMAEGFSRNEANQKAREIVSEGLSYQGDYNADTWLGKLDAEDLAKAIEAMRAVLENAVETVAGLANAFAAGMVAFNKAFTEAL